MQKTCQCLSHVGNRCYRCTYGPLMGRLESGSVPRDQSEAEEMRQELDNARCLVSILVRKAGGHVRITQKDLFQRPTHVRFFAGTDVETGDYILSVIEIRG